MIKEPQFDDTIFDLTKPEIIKGHFDELQNGFKEPEQATKENIFLIRTMNQCLIDAKTRPIPKKLFSYFHTNNFYWFPQKTKIYLL